MTMLPSVIICTLPLILMPLYRPFPSASVSCRRRAELRAIVILIYYFSSSERSYFDSYAERRDAYAIDYRQTRYGEELQYIN